MKLEAIGWVFATGTALGSLFACGDGASVPSQGVAPVAAPGEEEQTDGSGDGAASDGEPAPNDTSSGDPSSEDVRPTGLAETGGESQVPAAPEGEDSEQEGELTEGSDDAPEPPPEQVDTPVEEQTAAPLETTCTIPAPALVPIGYGAATTGGGSTTPIVVNSFAEAEAALADYRSDFDDGVRDALVLRYTGVFDFGSITDVCAQHEKDARRLQIKEMDNVTFEGASGSSGNFGIQVNRAHNVIIRNMTLGLLPGGGDSDAITIEGNDTNGDVEDVWIDHNELFSSTKDDCPGAGDTEFDGLIDIKKGARRITVSYNYLHDHQKTGLLGFSDSDDTERYVTFHHNRYENVVSRTPLLRYGFVHLFNNYYGDISSSGINVRMGGVALIESNFFENVANPITSRYSPEVGFWDLRDNHLEGGITWSVDDDTLANADDWRSTIVFPEPELDYEYTPDPAHCVKQILQATAGATL